jgi:fructose-1,6-bisphosphatase I
MNHLQIMKTLGGIALLLSFHQTTNAFGTTKTHPSALLHTSTSASTSTTLLQSSLDPLGPPTPINSAKTTQRKKNLKTFARYLEIESWKRGPSARDLEPVLRSIGEACRQINRIVQRAQTDDLYGVAVGQDGEQLDENVQGEVQQKLDVVCNEIMLKQFCGSSSGVIAAVASEEEDLPRTCCDVMVSDEMK